MRTWLNFVLLLAFMPMSLCVLVLQIQIVLGWRRVVRLQAGLLDGDRPCLAVLVPAHDESSGIEATLVNVLAQTLPMDRVLVVADNCSDNTAVLARAAGVEVVERHDLDRIGKGHALAFGLAALRQKPPQVLVIVDADCRLDSGALDILGRTALLRQRPVQARYVMDLPTTPTLPQKVAAFAWRVRNVARPLGWHRLGGPCQLMGTGMAFPWHQIKDAMLAHSDLVEDMRLGVDLAMAGHPPLYCDQAVVRSWFPESGSATQTQRTRWEHGHLASIIEHVPRLILRGLTTRRPALLGLALDLMVPPLALLVLVMVACWCVAAVAGWLGGVGWAMAWMSLCTASLMVSLGLAWSRHARDVLSLREWLAIPGYVLGKLAIYRGFLKGRQKHWVRTGRDTE